MQKKSELRFENHDFSDVRNSFVLLDIDGTLVPHGGNQVSESVRRQVTLLIGLGNRIYLLSNNQDKKRGETLARELGVDSIVTKYRKPSQRALGALSRNDTRQNWVVIGDKVLTDGLFAKNLNAQFIKVKSLRAPSDSLWVCSHYWLDWCAKRFFKY